MRDAMNAAAVNRNEVTGPVITVLPRGRLEKTPYAAEISLSFLADTAANEEHGTPKSQIRLLRSTNNAQNRRDAGTVIGNARQMQLTSLPAEFQARRGREDGVQVSIHDHRITTDPFVRGNDIPFLINNRLKTQSAKTLGKSRASRALIKRRRGDQRQAYLIGCNRGLIGVYKTERPTHAGVFGDGNNAFSHQLP
jgi:hypothetical protein